MATTINLATDMTLGVYNATGVAASNNYVVIPIEWADLDGYPEILVETSIDDTDYYPAKIISDMGMDNPVKLRCTLEDGSETLTVDSIYGDTPYARITVYANTATLGTITFEINAG